MLLAECGAELLSITDPGGWVEVERVTALLQAFSSDVVIVVFPQRSPSSLQTASKSHTYFKSPFPLIPPSPSAIIH